jgi:nucleoside-diphosphate-sugar epimerase
VEDVAEFVVKIVADRDIVNEAVSIGGPSNVTQNHLATLLERRFNTSGKRRHIPATALRLLPPVVRPFNELAARLMTLGLYSTAYAQPFDDWRTAADRLGVAPRSVETYVDQMPNPK